LHIAFLSHQSDYTPLLNQPCVNIKSKVHILNSLFSEQFFPWQLLHSQPLPSPRRPFG